MLTAAKAWAAEIARDRPEVRRVLCFGSAAGGTWGVGSDLDLLVEVAVSDTPFERRSLAFPPPRAPVPVEILVYTTDELARMRREGRRFIREVDAGSALLYPPG